MLRQNTCGMKTNQLVKIVLLLLACCLLYTLTYLDSALLKIAELNQESIRPTPVRTLAEREDTLEENSLEFYKIQDTLAERKDTLAERKDTLAERKDTKPEKSCFDRYQEMRINSTLGSMPWVDPEGVRILCKVLGGGGGGGVGLSVLEWGCGGSTVFFSRFVKKWRCIEHVPQWGAKVEGLLASQPHRDRVSVHVIEPSTAYNSSIPPANNNDGTYEQFSEYIEYPATLRETFNVIIDDGRARVEAAGSVLRNNLLSTDGVVIIHDWERTPYHKVFYLGFKMIEEDRVSPRHLAVLKPLGQDEMIIGGFGQPLPDN